MAWRVETGLLDAIAPFMQGDPITRNFDLQTEI